MIDMLVSKWIFQFVQVHLIHDPQTQTGSGHYNCQRRTVFQFCSERWCLNMCQQYSTFDCPEPWRSGEVYAYAEQLHALPAEQKRRCARPKGTYSGSDVPCLYEDGVTLVFPLFSRFYLHDMWYVFVFFFSSCCSGFHCWCVLYPKLFLEHSNLAIANENSSEGWSWWAGLRSSFDATGADLIFSWRY